MSQDNYLSELRDQVAAGLVADRVVSNAEVMGAMADLRQRFIDQWAKSPTSSDPEEVRKRDDLHRMVSVIDTLVRRFRTDAQRGQDAHRQLIQLENENAARR